MVSSRGMVGAGRDGRSQGGDEGKEDEDLK